MKGPLTATFSAAVACDIAVAFDAPPGAVERITFAGRQIWPEPPKLYPEARRPHPMKPCRE